jgi:hypothetical protein
MLRQVVVGPRMKVSICKFYNTTPKIHEKEQEPNKLLLCTEIPIKYTPQSETVKKVHRNQHN